MNILYICKVKNPKGNGVISVITEQIKRLEVNHNIALLNLGTSISPKISKKTYTKEKKIEDLPSPFNHPDIVVFQEIYKPEYIKLYKECLKNNIPYIIVPHGSLNQIAQKKKRIKKILGNIVFFNKFIKEANAIAFLNEKEKKDSKFKYKDAVIISNGSNIPREINNPIKPYQYVFIGRYSIYTKGLDILLEVVKELKEWMEKNNIQIQLYGRDSTGNETETMKQIIKENNLEQICKINNPIYAEEKEKILQKAYCFIQLSRHEGQPMGIIEALSYGLPCIVTTGTSFKEYCNTNKCGIGISLEKEKIKNAIIEMYNNKDKRKTFSKNARECAKRDFDWEKIIKKIEKEYINIIKNN